MHNVYMRILYDQAYLRILILVLLLYSGLGEHPLVKTGCIILQDKASCFPSQILGDIITSNTAALQSPINRYPYDIIDGCSAPGNKTSHLANFLHNITTTATIAPSSTSSSSSTTLTPPKIYAFEKDRTRFDLLTRRMKTADAYGTYIHTIHQDFLSLNPDDPTYQHVKYVLMDPSCSGSGLRSIERLGENRNTVNATTKNGSSSRRSMSDVESDPRLLKLQSFQISVLLHAMSIPSVEYLVYSTCSIHEVENEAVVKAVLDATHSSSDSCSSNFGSTGNSSTRGSRWELIAPPRFNTWTRRGHTYTGLTAEQSACLIRCSPDEDNTSGFFVAVFHRIGHNSDSSFALSSIPSTMWKISDTPTHTSNTDPLIDCTSSSSSDVIQLRPNKRARSLDINTTTSGDNLDKGQRRRSVGLWRPYHKHNTCI